jgi:hypothetical protein
MPKGGKDMKDKLREVRCSRKLPWAAFSAAAVGLCGLLLSVPALGFKGPTHRDVTENGLKNSCRTIASQNLCFTPDSIEQIVTANNASDGLYGQVRPSFHFDAESFGGASFRLTNLKFQIIQKITADAPDGSGARDLLGQALHSVQDFYAHTSWVNDFTGIDTNLGRAIFDPGDEGPPPVADATTPTCPTDPYQLGGSGLTMLTSGYFELTSPCYTGPAGKCGHGGFPWLTCSEGISKDDDTRPFFAQAQTAASLATLDFISQILDDPAVTGNAKATKALMGLKGGTLGFVIDTTGSMGDIISEVQSEVDAIVDSVKGTDKEPGQYLLEPFNDPTVGPPTATSDASAFESAVNSLTAEGGGDCPELSFSGLLQAIAASDPGSTLYLYTDADAKDDDLESNVDTAAAAKGIKVVFALFGDCTDESELMRRKSHPMAYPASNYDPAYFQVAAQTGGQTFLLDRDEAGAITNIVTPQLGQRPSTLLSVADVLNTGDMRNYVVPIDSTVTSVTFSISIDTPGTIQVTDPTDTVVTAGSGVTITTLSSGEIITVTAPMAGNWGLQVSGTGSLTVTVLAQTNVTVQNGSVQFTQVAFVQLQNLYHPYYFPIPGQPVVGTAQTLRVDLVGPYATANFQVLDATGTLIQALALSRGTDPNAGSSSFMGSFTVPAQPFRIAASGTDTSSNPYFRVFPQLFTAQTLQVTAANEIGTLTLGTTASLTFSVQNLGASDTFNIRVTDSCGAATGCGFITGSSPSQLALDSGASGTVTVQLAAPLDLTQLGTTDIVSITATSASNPNVSNGAAQSFTVIGSVVSMSTSALNFPDQPVGAAGASLPVTITNTGTDVLNISTDTVTGTNAGDFVISADTCAGATVNLNGTCNISVTFTPAATGARAASLNIADNSAGSPQVIPLSGNGLAAVLSLSAPTLGLGGQVVTTTSAAQTETITNNGNTNLTISTVAIGGANAGDFAKSADTCTGATVNPGGTCAIHITFTPAAGGARTATLTITDNAPGSPQTVPLSGNGEDFSLAVASGSSPSATVTAGQTATYPLAITPLGGFNQSVSFSCSGAPSLSTCSVSPSPLALNGSSAVSTTVTVTTTAASALGPKPKPPAGPWIGLWMLAILAALGAPLLAGRRFAWRRAWAPLAVVALALALWVGCGGGGGAPATPTSKPGTPSGDYSLTVSGTFTSGTTTVTHNIPLTLHVD